MRGFFFADFTPGECDDEVFVFDIAPFFPEIIKRRVVGRPFMMVFRANDSREADFFVLDILRNPPYCTMRSAL